MQSLIKDLSADTVCKVSEQSEQNAEKNVTRKKCVCVPSIPTAQVIVEENRKSGAKVTLTLNPVCICFGE